MTDAITNEIISKIQSLPKAEARKVIDAIKSLKLFDASFSDFITENRFSTGVFCPRCNSKKVRKNGFNKTMQRFFCADCNKSFSVSTNTITHSSKKTLEIWQKYVDCMISGLSVRKSAAICGICKDTAFKWRHKILDALQVMHNSVELSGVVEADETFFAVSFKGNHKMDGFIMPREAHKRGNDTHIRGISHEKVCVPCAVTQEGLSIAKPSNLGRVSTKNLSEVFSGHITINSVLCADAHHSYQKFAKENRLELIQLKTGKSKKGIFHVQHINSYHSILKTWIVRLHGVATKYLDNYLVWHNFVNWAKDPYEAKSINTDWTRFL